MQVYTVHAVYAQAFGFIQIYADFMQAAAGIYIQASARWHRLCGS
jgi:hypothetical protein